MFTAGAFLFMCSVAAIADGVETNTAVFLLICAFDVIAEAVYADATVSVVANDVDVGLTLCC